YSAPLADMFDQGYLTPPETLPVEPVDMTGVRKTAGDFNQAEMQSRFLGRSITKEIYETCNKHGHKSIAVYASGVAHATLLHHELQALGEESVLITGETLPLLRATSIDLFAKGSKRWIVNVDCLTTGWDASNIDCIVVARATESAGLFMQIVGRGTRLHEGKEKFYVIDYGGNIDRFGAIDCEDYGKDFIKDPTTGDGDPPQKCCPRCFEIVHASAMTCVKCGYAFPKREKVLVSTKAAIRVKTVRRSVVHESFKEWVPKDENKLPTLRVQYKLAVDDDNLIQGGVKRWASEWLCINHKGYAREKFCSWWKERSHTHPPETIEEAMEIIKAGGLAKTIEIDIRPDGKFDRIVKHYVGIKPDACDMDDLPF
ncbi:MAG: DEAD/DEAH box helicase, partial [Pirellulales bacterium]